MKKVFKRSVLAGFALVLALSVFSPLSVTPARAQEASPSAPAGDSTKSGQKSEQEVDENDAYRHSTMVKKLGGMVGMDAEQSATLFEVLNFAVLAAFVLWALAKTLPKTFRSRNDAIQKHLVDARTATEEASARLNVVESRLGKLDGEIAAMRAQAEQDAARDEARIKAAVEIEKQNILVAAEQEINAATSHAQKQLQQYAAELAIEQAARKLVVSAETDRLLVQSFAERLTGGESKKGQN